MLSVNYSLNTVTFDPKGKILQVTNYFVKKVFNLHHNRSSMQKKQ